MVSSYHQYAYRVRIAVSERVRVITQDYTYAYDEPGCRVFVQIFFTHKDQEAEQAWWVKRSFVPLKNTELLSAFSTRLEKLETHAHSWQELADFRKPVGLKMCHQWVNGIASAILKRVALMRGWQPKHLHDAVDSQARISTQEPTSKVDHEW